MAETGVPFSFIPQDAGRPPSIHRRSGGLGDLLGLGTIVLFVASAALGAGVFLYQQYLEAESSSKLAQLERAKVAFEPSLIRELTRLDDRMYAADKILSVHAAPSAFFRALQEATLVTVSFRSLDFQATDPQHMTISMVGVARSVNSIALQADLFSKNKVISGPIFSNIERQSDGVHFNLSAIVNPLAINYASVLGGFSGTGAQNQIVPQQGAQSEIIAPGPSSSPILPILPAPRN